MSRKRVAVFDFDREAGAELMRTVEQALDTTRAQGCAVFLFSDTQAVTRAVQVGGYDMAFVVIESMTAMETARLMRESAPILPLFLVSNTGDYALEGFRLNALDYLMRPVSERRVVEAVARIDSPAMQCRL